MNLAFWFQRRNYENNINLKLQTHYVMRRAKRFQSSRSAILIFLLACVCIFVILAKSLSFSKLLSTESTIIKQRGHRNLQNAISNKIKIIGVPPIDEDSFSTTTTTKVATSTVVIQNVSDENRSGTILLRTISWKASSKYLPLSSAAVEGFMVQEQKQKGRSPYILNSWRQWDSKETCSREVPECDFFLIIPQAHTLRMKCCAEHQKLKWAFLYTMDIIDAFNKWARSTGKREPIQIFLDSGALLSSVRDGGDTLIPWETDIDLGVIGGFPDGFLDAFGDGLDAGEGSGMSTQPYLRKYFKKAKGEWAGLSDSARKGLLPPYHPNKFLRVFDTWSSHQQMGSDGERSALDQIFLTYNYTLDKRVHKGSDNVLMEEFSHRPPHYFEPCIVKKSSNASRNGLCKDAHYIYYVSGLSETLKDTSRVEIYPFAVRNNSASDSDPLLEHPTRKWLSVPQSWVLPLEHSCRLWGRLIPCPHLSHKYLDQEYGEGTWLHPQTIHWGEKNILPWK